MRYVLKLSYCGAAFCGWQIQNDSPSVQQAIQDALSTLLREEITITGAGRTDTGVNAIGYVAHFDSEPIPDAEQILYKLNAILPKGIVIDSISQAPDNFHARFDATNREYTYFLHRVKDPFVEKFSLFHPYNLDFELMNRAAGFMLGTHDFSCFEKIGADNKTSLCTVTEAAWHPYTPTHVALMGGRLTGDATADSSFLQAGTALSPDGSLHPLAGTALSPDGSLHPLAGTAISPDGSLHPLAGTAISPDGSLHPLAGTALSPDGSLHPLAGTALSPDGSLHPLAGTTLSESARARSLNGLYQTDLPAEPRADYWYFRISANRFLRNMVRATVGTLMEVGRGRRSLDEFQALLDGGSRCDAGESVPGNALFLSKVEY